MKGLAGGLLIFFVFLGLMSSQCLCDMMPPSEPLDPVYAWVSGEEFSYRFEPVHTHSVVLPDDATASEYYSLDFIDEYEEYDGESAYNNYLAGWTISDNTGTEACILTGGRAWWVTGPPWVVASEAVNSAVLWDFSNLPSNATILEATLHVLYSQFDWGSPGYTARYYAQDSYLGTATLPGLDEDEQWSGDLDAGTDWPKADQQWLTFHSELTHSATLTLPNSEDHSNVNRKSSRTDLALAWGLYSEDDYTYIEITYTVPTWQCVENCP